MARALGRGVAAVAVLVLFGCPPSEPAAPGSEACGGQGEACCVTAAPCAASGLTCAAGTCVACGGSGQPCCGTTCSTALFCNSGFCDPVPPNQTGTPCTADDGCNSGLCQLLEPSVGVCTTACASTPECVAGWSCAAATGRATDVCQCVPAGETCDGLDDDCNGVVDDAAIANFGCGVATPGSTCQDGACACPAAWTLCTDHCSNLATSAADCGTCGVPCGAGEVCTGGACACAPGSDYCGGTICRPLTQLATCGGCTTSCSAGQFCNEAAACSASCRQGPVVVPADNGGATGAIAGGDFDGDGTRDLAVADDAGANVRVLLGRGDGTFWQKGVLATGAGPTQVIASDLDADGKLDLAVRNALANSVSVFKGVGDGTFAPKVDYALPFAPTSVSALDLTGDARPELIVFGSAAQTVRVLLNGGSGTFTIKADYATAAGPSSLTISECTGDLIGDLIVPNDGADTVSIFPGVGDGTFAARVDLATGAGPYWATCTGLGSVSSTGRNVLVVNKRGNSVSIIPLSAPGTWGPHVDYATEPAPVSLGWGNLDDDAFPEVWVRSSGANSLRVFKNNGDRTLGASADVPLAAGAFAAWVFDTDFDGKLDIVSFGGSVVGVSRGTGGLSFATRADFATPAGARSANQGSFDADGSLDVAVNGTGGLYTILNKGPFGLPTRYATSTGPDTLATGDFNNDDVQDLVVGHAGLAAVNVLLGNGDGTYQPYRTLVTGGNAVGVATAYLDGDANLDLITSNGAAASVSVFLGNGDGSFKAKVDYPSVASNSLRVADVNADGKVDVVGGGQAAYSVLLGNGDGTLQAKIDGNLDLTGWGNLVVGEFNKDGKPDLAAINSGRQQIIVCPGAGDGTFSCWSLSSSGGSDARLDAVDLNGDGVTDLVAGSGNAYAASSLHVLIGKGTSGTPNGFFAVPVAYGAGLGIAGIAHGDFNGDHVTDLVVSHGLSGRQAVGVYLGNGDGTLQPLRSYGTLDPTRGLAVGDLDRDGKADVVLSQQYANDVAVLLGRCDPP